MQDLHTLQTSQLIDLLSKQTDHYTNMLGQETSNEEFEKCKIDIQAIQKEIQSRNDNESTSVTTSPDFIV